MYQNPRLQFIGRGIQFTGQPVPDKPTPRPPLEPNPELEKSTGKPAVKGTINPPVKK
jgi:hypothetical protein